MHLSHEKKKLYNKILRWEFKEQYLIIVYNSYLENKVDPFLYENYHKMIELSN